MLQSFCFVDEKTGNPQRLASSIEVMLLLEKRATELEFDFVKSIFIISLLLSGF